MLANYCEMPLHKYDEDANRSYSFKEFRKMISDPLLQGRHFGYEAMPKMKKVASEQPQNSDARLSTIGLLTQLLLGRQDSPQ